MRQPHSSICWSVSELLSNATRRLAKAHAIWLPTEILGRAWSKCTHAPEPYITEPSNCMHTSKRHRTLRDTCRCRAAGCVGCRARRAVAFRLRASLCLELLGM